MCRHRFVLDMDVQEKILKSDGYCRIGMFRQIYYLAMEKYVKRKHIPYMELEFHYPDYLFIALGSIVVVIFLVIAIAYFSIK